MNNDQTPVRSQPDVSRGPMKEASPATMNCGSGCNKPSLDNSRNAADGAPPATMDTGLGHSSAGPDNTRTKMEESEASRASTDSESTSEASAREAFQMSVEEWAQNQSDETYTAIQGAINNLVAAAGRTAGTARLLNTITENLLEQPHTDHHLPSRDSSVYLSMRSTFTSSSTSLFSFGSGRLSQDGATWKGAFTKTMNSGFAAGAPRSIGYIGVREGRERGGFLPRIRGIGRTGKAFFAVPATMLKALVAHRRMAAGGYYDYDDDEDDDDDWLPNVEQVRYISGYLQMAHLAVTGALGDRWDGEGMDQSVQDLQAKAKELAEWVDCLRRGVNPYKDIVPWLEAAYDPSSWAAQILCGRVLVDALSLAEDQTWRERVLQQSVEAGFPAKEVEITLELLLGHSIGRRR